MTTNAVLGVLAGGKATRLGSLGQTHCKSLVSSGSTPTIISQFRAARSAGIRQAAVLVPDRWREQMKQFFSGPAGDLLDVQVLTEMVSKGPGPGFAPLAEFAEDRPLCVVLADTWLSQWPTAGNDGETDWVAVASAPESRQWCVSDEAGLFKEAYANKGDQVTIGAYQFEDSLLLLNCALKTVETSSTEISQLLNLYSAARPLHLQPVNGWHDMGTLKSLQENRSKVLLHRPTNHFTSHSNGYLIKSSEDPRLRDEVETLTLESSRGRHLFPRAKRHDDTSYLVEMLDMPNLASLYLYWDATPSEWARRVEELITVLQEEFWNVQAPVHRDSTVQWAKEALLEKLYSRIAKWHSPLKLVDSLEINRRDYCAGSALLRQLANKLEDVSLRATPAAIHGDLNFHNVLYSERHGTYRLLDPNPGLDRANGHRVGDLRYDFAKLRYSYHGHFARINEGLFTMRRNGREIDAPWLRASCRVAADNAMDEVLSKYSSLTEISLIEASILLAAPALHQEAPLEADALYVSGVVLANEALGLP
ncbi:sugar phosphate nucleotidyltransferase [Luteococcus sp. OSA5]|uniref:sugar phosphate nucleotidyltransferase n=1 Tax=Luteococcus sp. OSA5 TaxID=3401630 RepID=UPI003B42D895